MGVCSVQPAVPKRFHGSSPARSSVKLRPLGRWLTLQTTGQLFPSCCSACVQVPPQLPSSVPLPHIFALQGQLLFLFVPCALRDFPAIGLGTSGPIVCSHSCFSHDTLNLKGRIIIKQRFSNCGSCPPPLGKSFIRYLHYDS